MRRRRIYGYMRDGERRRSRREDKDRLASPSRVIPSLWPFPSSLS